MLCDGVVPVSFVMWNPPTGLWNTRPQPNLFQKHLHFSPLSEEPKSSGSKRSPRLHPLAFRRQHGVSRIGSAAGAPA